MNFKEQITNGIVQKAATSLMEKLPVVGDLMNDPETFKIEVFIEGEEIVIKLKKKEGS